MYRGYSSQNSGFDDEWERIAADRERKRAESSEAAAGAAAPASTATPAKAVKLSNNKTASTLSVTALLELIGFMFLFFMFFMQLIPTTFLIFGISVNGLYFLLSIILSVAAAVMLIPESKAPSRSVLAAMVFIVLLFALTLSYGRVYSIDWDGNVYHKMATGLIKNGWNPARESAERFAINYFKYVYHSARPLNHTATIIDHYGKAGWIFAGCVYAFTDNIECGKVFQPISILICFCLMLGFFSRKTLSLRYALPVSLLTAINPVSLVQLLSYYVDGFLFEYFFILLIGLTYLLNIRRDRYELKLGCIIVFCTMPVLANIKFTGLLYGGIFCVVYFLMYMGLTYLQKTDLNSWLKHNAKVAGAFAGLALFSMIWIGYPTYLKNLIDHHTMTYPITGMNLDIISSQQPSGYAERSTFFKLFYTTFGEFGSIMAVDDEELPKLKIPFSIHASELSDIPDVDTRISGFGLFFSGILLISVIIYLIYFFFIKDMLVKKIYFAVNISLIALMMFAVSESWWARFSPHAYLLVIYPLILLSFMGKNNFKAMFTFLFTLLISANTLYFVLQPVQVMKYNLKFLQHDFAALKNSRLEILNPEWDFHGKFFNFEDDNIEYIIVDNIDKPEGTLYWEYYRFKRN